MHNCIESSAVNSTHSTGNPSDYKLNQNAVFILFVFQIVWIPIDPCSNLFRIMFSNEYMDLN